MKANGQLSVSIQNEVYCICNRFVIRSLGAWCCRKTSLSEDLVSSVSEKFKQLVSFAISVYPDNYGGRAHRPLMLSFNRHPGGGKR